MRLKAVLFGSIGTLAETSDIQRNSFNEAFKISGLDWVWDENCLLYTSPSPRDS